MDALAAQFGYSAHISVPATPPRPPKAKVCPGAPKREKADIVRDTVPAMQLDFGSSDNDMSG